MIKLKFLVALLLYSNIAAVSLVDFSPNFKDSNHVFHKESLDFNHKIENFEKENNKSYLYLVICSKNEQMAKYGRFSAQGKVESLDNEDIVMAYYIISAQRLLEKVLNTWLANKDLKISFIELTQDFDHKGISKFKDQIYYFNKLFARLDFIDKVQFFPCNDNFINSLKSKNIENIKIEKTNLNEIKKNIDLDQISIVDKSVLNDLKEKSKENLEVLNYLEDPINSSSEINQFFKNICEEYKQKVFIIFCKDKNGFKYNFMRFLDITPNLDYKPSNCKDIIIHKYKCLFGNDFDIDIKKQPVLDLTFSRNNNSKTLLASSHTYLTNLKPYTEKSINFLSKILTYYSEILVAQRNAENLALKIKSSMPLDKEELFAAITHTSKANQIQGLLRSYESLEFLGDAVLSFIIAKYFLCVNPNAKVKKISSIYEEETSNANFAKALENLNLINIVWNTQGEEIGNSKILADVIESIIGAMFISFYNYSKQNDEVNLSDIMKFYVEKIKSEKVKDIGFKPSIISVQFPNRFFAITKEISNVLDKIEEVINYKFKNRFILIEALISEKAENINNQFIKTLKFINPLLNNRKLAYLGFSITKFIIATFFYLKNPIATAHQLDKNTHIIVPKVKLPDSLKYILKNSPFIHKEYNRKIFSSLVAAVYCDSQGLYKFDNGIDIANQMVYKFLIKPNLKYLEQS